MKLSICIPVYNFDVRELVYDLKKEINNNYIDAEILLIDDASTPYYKLLNKELEGEVKSFVFLEENIGRSQIRNRFINYSIGDYLLFLDCDGKIINPDFLKNYINFLENDKAAKVVYGGRKVSDIQLDASHLLRWKFSKERENILLKKRLLKPYLSFQTNNFMVEKSIFEKVNFNPEFQKYGYEDLLLAMDLKTAGISIHHIDNPIFNNDIETNEVYLKKVEESVESLYMMLTDDKIAPKIKDIKLVKAYYYLTNSYGVEWFRKLFVARKDATKTKLLRGNCSLRYLDFYKLGFLTEKIKQKNLTSL